MELKLLQPSWQQEERICLKMARSKNGTRDEESHSYDFITKVIESNWVWIIELFDYMKSLCFFLLHTFCVACNCNRVLTTVFLTTLSNAASCSVWTTSNLWTQAHLNLLTHWNYLSYFHLFLNIYFGTIQMARRIYYVYLALYTLLRFVQVLCQITLTSQEETESENRSDLISRLHN